MRRENRFAGVFELCEDIGIAENLHKSARDVRHFRYTRGCIIAWAIAVLLDNWHGSPAEGVFPFSPLEIHTSFLNWK